MTLFAVAGFSSALVAAPDGDRVGTPWVGEPGIRERTADIMQREAEHPRGNRPFRVHKLARIELPEAAEGDLTPPASADGGPQAADAGSFAQTVTNIFQGATLADCQAYPPDTMGSAGPTQFIIALNGRVRSFNKNTGAADGAINVDTDVFFNSVMTPPTANNFTSDPRIRYDRLSRRWFITMIDVPGSAGTLPNRVMIAVSDGPIVTGGTVWTFFQFQQDLVSPTGDTGAFADYPTLGVDANALYIGVNIFATRGLGSFSDTTGFVVRKSSLLSGGPIVVTAFRGLIPNGNSGGAYTPQGVDNYDPAATEGYFIGVNNKFFGQLSLRRISNPGGTPSISANINFSIPVNGGTINVPHLGNTGGTAGFLDGLDYRLLSAHIRNGHLWTTENMAVNSSGSPSGIDTRMAVRWYELQGIATGQTPSVVQSGTLFDSSANARCFWMGTIMVSGQGHAAMGFSVAGANDRVNCGTVGRLKDDAAGTMRDLILYTSTSASYNPRDSNNQPIDRWGDYSYTCLDPNDDMTMWTIQQFCNANNSYAVQIAKLLAPLPALPVTCSPSILTQGVANVTVTLTGMSDGDTGFFDPGAGFSNRITAAVNGSGVTVNSVTYNNPTNLTLNVSVSNGAGPGARTVTVANPDGQTATSASGILTIAGTGATNSPPSLAAISNKTVNEGQLLTFTNSATDPDGNGLTFTLDLGAPTNAVINPTNGVFSWIPAEAQGPSTNSITVRVTDDGVPPLSNAKTFSVTVNEVNSAPSLAPIGNKTVIEGQLLTFTNSASDPDIPTNTLTFSLGLAPTGAVINATSGVFSWTPSEAQGPKTNAVSVIVTDNGIPSLSATQFFTIVVLETNSAPTLSPISNRTVHAGSTVTFTNVATDPDIPTNTLTFTLDPGAPASASVGPGSGIFMWTTGDADADTTNSITVRVTDNGIPPASNAKTFLVNVISRPMITDIGISNSVVTVTWSAAAGLKYRLEFKTDLEEANWTSAAPDVIAGGPIASQADSTAVQTNRFYHVLVVP